MRDKDSPTFKEATTNMTGKEKASYIWEYYKLHILASIAVFLLVFSMIITLTNRVESHLHLTFLSGFEHTMDLLDLALDPGAEQDPDRPGPPLGIWVNFEIVPILEDLLIDEDKQAGYEITVQPLVLNFETASVFATHSIAGAIDIIVTYIPDLHAMVEVEHFINISELGWDLPEHVMYNEYAVYLRYFPIFDGYVAPMDDLVLGISSATMQIENVEAFFEALLD